MIVTLVKAANKLRDSRSVKRFNCDIKDVLEGHQRAQIFQGQQLADMGPWPAKEHFELCPQMWFWAYNAQNPVYPNMMICSPTPFWTKGKASINLSISLERLHKRIRP